LVYSGSPDALFNYNLGELEYRSLRFHDEVLKEEDFQGNAIVNYTHESVPFTRIIEHKHFNNSKNSFTVITKEYPREWNRMLEAYYPVVTKKSMKRYSSYRDQAKAKGIILGGRLGSFKYLDMDQTIASAFNKSKIKG
jgi:UDP-galactopyranose mutase